jgi:hypothetical protein
MCMTCLSTQTSLQISFTHTPLVLWILTNWQLKCCRLLHNYKRIGSICSVLRVCPLVLIWSLTIHFETKNVPMFKKFWKHCIVSQLQHLQSADTWRYVTIFLEWILMNKLAYTVVSLNYDIKMTAEINKQLISILYSVFVISIWN